MIHESMKAMAKLHEDLAKVDPRPRITGIQDPTKRKARPRFKGRLMGRTVANIHWHSEVIRDVLRDHTSEPKTTKQKAELLDEYIQHTRERCHVIQAELDEWRAALARWEEEKG